MTTFNIEIAGAKPVYLQIEEHIRRQIALGELNSGSRIPAVRDLAKDLGVNVNTVARAYIELVRDGILVSHRGGGTVVGTGAHERVMGDRSKRLIGMADDLLALATGIGYTLDEVEASVILATERWRHRSVPEPLLTPDYSSRRTVAFAGSHDLMLEALARRLANSRPPVIIDTRYVGSLEGIVALVRGEADVAGCHLLDQESGEYNIPFARRMLSGQTAIMVSMVRRVQGMFLAKDNPKRISGLEDLQRNDVALANRQRGSGTRVLLDYLLRKAGIDSFKIEGYEQEYDTHSDVASAVAQGRADAGIGIQAAAGAYGLEFIPLAEEPYDLIFSSKAFRRDDVQKLLATLKSPSFKRLVSAMGGYDIRTMGEERVIA